MGDDGCMDVRKEQDGYKPDGWGMVDVWDAKDEQDGCKHNGWGMVDVWDVSS